MRQNFKVAERDGYDNQRRRCRLQRQAGTVDPESAVLLAALK
jgi:hypothetical protein